MESQGHNGQTGSTIVNGPEVEEFIGKEEVARRLKKAVRTIDNWMQSGRLPYYKINRSVTFRWSEVMEHLRETCRVGTRR